MATYHVKTTGNDTTGDGSEGNPYATPAKAASVATSDGDIIYVETGTYNLSTTVVNDPGGPVNLNSGTTITMEGYETTAGDGCPNGNYPVLYANGNTPAGAYMVKLNGTFDNIHVVKFFEVDGDGQSTQGFDGSSVNYSKCIDCVATNCDGSNGFDTLNAVKCFATGCSGDGFYACDTYGCVATACGTGFENGGQQVVSCIAYANTGDGFYSSAFSSYYRCTAYNNGSDGFALGSDEVAVDCVAVSDGAYAYNTDVDVILINCAHYNIVSGRTNTAPLSDIGAITLTGVPFENAGSADFRPNSTANQGAELRGGGFGVYGQTDNRDIGAVQHADPAGGGGVVLSNMSGGMTG